MKLVKLIAVAASLLLLGQTTDQSIYTLVSTGEPCPPEGSAKDLHRKMLNRDKNRFTAPTPAQINASATLDAILEPLTGDETTDEGRFDPKHGARITGVVVDVKPGGCARHAGGKGGEGCNCNATEQVDCDTHISVALAADAPETQQVIVEVTPRLRLIMKNQGVDWSTEALKGQLKGRVVQFTGWLLFDFEHTGQAEMTNPGNASNFRATCWEVHPVTGFQVLDAQPEAVRALTPAALKAKQLARAQQVGTNPQLKKKIADRNQALGLLYKEETEEEGAAK